MGVTGATARVEMREEVEDRAHYARSKKAFGLALFLARKRKCRTRLLPRARAEMALSTA